jgi:hypothetical protein
MSRYVVKLAVWLLKRVDLSAEDKNKLLNQFLDNSLVLPFRAIIERNNNGELLLNGRTLEIEQARKIREGAKVILNNYTWKLISDQINYLAVMISTYKSEKTEQLLFTKAVIWQEQQTMKLLQDLAGMNENEELA